MATTPRSVEEQLQDLRGEVSRLRKERDNAEKAKTELHAECRAPARGTYKTQSR